LGTALGQGFRATAAAADIKGLDAYFICVPSPLGRSREPDLSYIKAAIDLVARVIEPGALVSLESTTYPGTTEDIIVTALKAAGLRLDEDVFVAYSPERVDPGSGLDIHEIPKVVGGVSPASSAVAQAAYGRLVDTVHPVSDAKVAELSKLLENTYRSVNIALANEMAQLADEMGVSIWETIDAAASKPFGFHAFYPGPGVGGHCIPLDPQYLAWKAREVGGSIRFIDLAEQVNTNMPKYVVDRVGRLLNDRGRALKGSTVLAVGLTYKRNVADDRESPSVEVVERLADRGANVHVIEPLLSQASVEAHGVTAVNNGSGLGAIDLAVVLTDHDDIDYAAIAAAVPVVFDTRAAYRRRGIVADNVVEI
jgi:UDP-N-acetyl-D-glucosamine dehydrogenase